MGTHQCKHPKLAFTVAIGAGMLAWKTINNRRASFDEGQTAVSQTAVITGASSGLGESFARRLASDGYNLILVARRQKKLEAIAQELEAAHGINVTIIVADLIDENDVNRLADQLSTVDNLVMLINNAGFGSRGNFIDVPARSHHDMIDVHVTAPVILTHAVLPKMIAQGRGAIINVSSTSAFYRGHDRVNYGATKLYLNAFSESLQIELEGSGVRVQALCPGFMYSGFHEQFGRPSTPSFVWLETDDVVDTSLKALNKKTVVVVPGLVNRIQLVLINIGLGSVLLSLFYKLSGKEK